MRYKYSQVDHKNLKWFAENTSRATLVSIQIAMGEVRGLHDIQIDFSYPITAIAGRNGSGKSTLLALAACAYHNSRTGYRMHGRKYSYYSYSDFFIQSPEDIPLQGIDVRYQYLHDRWRGPKRGGLRAGPGWQNRTKHLGGRWTKNSRRIYRTVVFLGVDRVVPHSEKSVAKSYRRSFRKVDAKGYEARVRNIVGRILDRTYTEFDFRQHSKYRLPVVVHRKITYSGFNMGAGENTLFGIVSVILECPEGSLIVIDEIELGLHEEAQGRLIEELKQLCDERKIQIICTTHSPQILACLPPEGRIFLERVGDSTAVIPAISPAFASGKLAGRPSVELDVLVEDDAAQLIVEASLTQDLRQRVNVIPVGSAAAVMRHLAVRYKEHRALESCAILDGDKEASRISQVKQFMSALESNKNIEDAKEWANDRLEFLPGPQWPEAWVIAQGNSQAYQNLSKDFDLPAERVEEIYAAAARAGKHDEFHEAAQRFFEDEKIIAHRMVKYALEAAPAEGERIRRHIQKLLD